MSTAILTSPMSVAVLKSSASPEAPRQSTNNYQHIYLVAAIHDEGLDLPRIGSQVDTPLPVPWPILVLVLNGQIRRTGCQRSSH